MGRRAARAAAIAVGLLLLLGPPALAHEGEEGAGLSVEPSQVSAGGVVVLAGQGLEPDSVRQIGLAGPDVHVPFPSVTTDAEGMFAVTLTIPGHLPPGTYTFQAIGDETLTADLAITAAAGQPPAGTGSDTGDAITPRERSPLEVALWAALVFVALGAGALLVVRAERLGRLFEPPAAR